jgi:hypothetical protein
MRTISRRSVLKSGAMAGAGFAAAGVTTSEVHAETNTVSAEFTVAGMPATATLELDRPVPDNTTFTVETTRLSAAKECVRLRLSDGSPLPVRKFTVDVALPFDDLHRMWYTQQIGGLGWSTYVSLPWGATIPASGNQGCLIAAAQSRHGKNRGLLAFKDQGGDGSLDFKLEYGGGAFHIAINRFAEGRTYTLDEFDETVYFDAEDVPWNKSVAAFVKWYDNEHSLTYTTPSFCYEPAFNSWYPLKTAQKEADLLRFADMTERLGVGTFEIDHGWFRTYEQYDLHTDNIPDMRRLIDRFHDHGLRVIAWFRPFHIGGEDAFHDLRVVENGVKSGELCVRTREVQERAGRLAGEIMRKYNLDGLKVDFLDASTVKLINCEADHEHVTDFVSDGAHAAMKNMADAIRAVKSDAIIEYRLNYANVATRQYCNIFRGQDAPSDPDHVRRHLALLRSWSTGVAPNADYAYWTPDLSDVEVARFMAGMVLYGVPTLSVDFDTLPASHFAIAKAWLALYRENIERLIHGDFQPLSSDPHYSVARTTSPAYTFACSFLERWPAIIEVPQTSSQYVFLFNGTAYPEIRTQLSGLSGSYEMEVLDPALKRVGNPFRVSVSGSMAFAQEVPVGGSVWLRKR